MKGKLLNSTKYEGKTYTLGDVNGFIDVKTIGFDDSFYGGRVRNFGKVTDSNILLCVEKESVIDIFVPDESEQVEHEEVKLDEMSRAELVKYAKEVGVQGNIVGMKTDVILQEIEKLEGNK